MHNRQPLGSEAVGDGEIVAEGAAKVVAVGTAESAAEIDAEIDAEGSDVAAVGAGTLSLAGAEGEATEQPAASTAAAVVRAARRDETLRAE